jgi:hypothetical protein
MRSTEEIAAYIESATGVFDFTTAVCLDYLPWEQAKPFLRDEYVAKVEAGEEEHKQLTPDHATVLAEMKDYMPFALGKAANHRGLSANRSISKMVAWLWLLGDDELRGQIEREEIGYTNYGAPILKAICEKYDFPIALEDNDWAPDKTAFLRMAEGKPCEPGCIGGCGA